jgi:hypothetical protein
LREFHDHVCSITVEMYFTLLLMLHPTPVSARGQWVHAKRRRR